MATTASIYRPVILREIRKCGGNIFDLPADLGKEQILEFARGNKASELHIFEEVSAIRGLASPRFSGTAAECCDKWLADRLASFLAAWEKKHPGDVTLNTISNAVSEIRYWVRENMEDVSFRDLSDEYFPDALLDDDYFRYTAIQYNPIFWVLFEFCCQNSYDPSKSVFELVKVFEDSLFDSAFIFSASQELYEIRKRNAA